MADVTHPPRRQSGPSDPAADHRIRGWLLLLCLMFTVVGPLISAGLMVDRYQSLAPYFAGWRYLQLALVLCTVIEISSVVFGIYAGHRLWAVRPGAVNTAKRALLWGLAANALSAALQLITGPPSATDGPLLDALLWQLVPDLIFFTACFAYLNKSARVQAIYRVPGGLPAGAGPGAAG